MFYPKSPTKITKIRHETNETIYLKMDNKCRIKCYIFDKGRGPLFYCLGPKNERIKISCAECNLSHFLLGDKPEERQRNFIKTLNKNLGIDIEALILL
jgi:hypothetical protein